VFSDESGLSLLPSVRATRAPRGETGILRHRLSCWKRLPLATAVCLRPGGSDNTLVFGMRPGSADRVSSIGRICCADDRGRAG
jgi:hypothetical protein